MTSYHGNQRFELLHGGRHDSSKGDLDWQRFCQRIGWQQPTAPVLPEDYEDQLVARIFGARARDNVVSLPLDPARRLPLGLGTLALSEAEIGELSELSEAELSEAGLSEAELSEAELSELDALGMGDRWRSAVPLEDVSTTARHELPAILAAVAIVALVVGTALLGWLSSSPGIASLPTPVPELSPTTTTTSAPPPEESAKAEQEAPLSDPDPGSSSVRLARRDRPKPRSASEAVRSSRDPSGIDPPDSALGAARAAERPGSWSTASEGYDPATFYPLGGSSLAHSPATMAAVTRSTPRFDSIATKVSTATADSKAMPQLVPSWFELDMTAPREISGVPAGVRVMAHLDVFQVGQALASPL